MIKINWFTGEKSQNRFLIPLTICWFFVLDYVYGLCQLSTTRRVISFNFKLFQLVDCVLLCI